MEWPAISHTFQDILATLLNKLTFSCCLVNTCHENALLWEAKLLWASKADPGSGRLSYFQFFKDFLHEVNKAFDFYCGPKLHGLRIFHLDRLSFTVFLLLLFFNICGFNYCVLAYGHANWNVRALNSGTDIISRTARTTCTGVKNSSCRSTLFSCCPLIESALWGPLA